MSENKGEPQQPAGGNILSNVPPPSELPSFIRNQAPQTSNSPTIIPTTTFSAAIPPNLAQNYHEAPPTQLPSNVSNSEQLSPTHETSYSVALNPLTQLASGASPTNTFLGWMKGAADVSGGILQKIGEKAMNSMDSIVTTLDPQMKEYIRSGGDVEIIIASNKDSKVKPIREAFQTIFGRATLMGLPVSSDNATVANQPVGFEAGLKACRWRIHQIRSDSRIGNKMPVIALENFLVELYPEHWFDLGLMVLDEPEQNIFIETFTQMTPVPASVAVTLSSETPKDYPCLDTGFSVTVGQIMATNLGVPHTDWHKNYAGVTRQEMVYLTAKTLATLYQSVLATKTQDYVMVAEEAKPSSTPDNDSPLSKNLVVDLK